MIRLGTTPGEFFVLIIALKFWEMMACFAEEKTFPVVVRGPDFVAGVNTKWKYLDGTGEVV